MIGVLGAFLFLCGAVYFISYIVLDDCYGVDIDIIQVVGVPLSVGGSFVATLGFFAAFVSNPILSVAIASLVGALFGSGFYLIAFLYERHLKNKNKSKYRCAYVSRNDYKIFTKECSSVMKITGLVSSVTFIVMSVVMFIVQFVF